MAYWQTCYAAASRWASAGADVVPGGAHPAPCVGQVQDGPRGRAWGQADGRRACRVVAEVCILMRLLVAELVVVPGVRG